ncbi:arginase family protein [Nocardioides panzhihuensis]|uniref:Arginase n=1 Tax=Nocardioides panzhihuensis TaxID=860243 RepID=A0A7Z0DLW8_9ACTN|nr:arginase family protein [Nocardioides panzhihuensis]NYI77820.1 arginase [Nocardioides panzhihuensis]
MRLLAPYHQDDLLPTLSEELPPDWADAIITADLPAGADGWERLAPIYSAVAEGVAGAQVSPTVVSGCCCVSLGTLAGLQRAGIDPAVVWIDAHGDVQTMETSASGYLGGMPLRMMAGYRPDLVADEIGLRPIQESRLVLVDARDLDEPEAAYLETAQIRRTSVVELDESALPDGPLLLHVDLDVIDPADLPGLRFPVDGGPSAAQVVEAVRRVQATGRVAAFDLAATWDPAAPDPDGLRRSLADELLNQDASWAGAIVDRR